MTVGFVVVTLASSSHLTTQRSSFQSKALLQVFGGGGPTAKKKTGLTTIYSAVTVHALIGHGPRHRGGWKCSEIVVSQARRLLVIPY